MKKHADGTKTLADVARLAGVSQTTASYVLNNKSKSIGAETRERIRKAASELGYRPNLAARSLVTKRTNIIALCVPDVASAFTARVVGETQRLVRRGGYDVLISDIESHDGDASPPSSAAINLPMWIVDGVIIFLGSAWRNARLDFGTSSHLPAVVMSAFPVTGVDFVGVELKSAATEAMQSLVAGGRKHIAYLVPASGNFACDDRRDAYRESVRDAGLPPLVIETRSNSRASARVAVREFLATSRSLDGLFCYNDECAIGAYRALREAGLRVPEDTAIVGCDGISDVEYLDCALSTIVLPIEDMCRAAWSFLQQRIDSPSLPPQSVSFSGRFEKRESL